MVSLLSLAVGIPILLYLLLWLGPVQRRICSVAEQELSKLLDAQVTIGRLDIEPFSRVRLNDADVLSRGDTLLTVGQLEAGISLPQLLKGDIVVTDLELMDADLRVSRANPKAPLNVQPVLDALKGDGKGPKPKFQLAVHTVVIRGLQASYDVLSEPRKEGKLDPNHLKIHDFRADITAPFISQDEVEVELRRLAFSEQSGLQLRQLASKVHWKGDRLELTEMHIRLPNSVIRPSDFVLQLKERDAIHLELRDGTYLAPSDFAALLPPTLVDKLPVVELAARVSIYPDSLSIHHLRLNAPDLITMDARGRFSAKAISTPGVAMDFNAPKLLDIASDFTTLQQPVRELVSTLGQVEIEGVGNWSKDGGAKFAGNILTAAGNLDLDALWEPKKQIVGTIQGSDLDLAALLPGKELGMTDIDADFSLGPEAGEADVTLGRIIWRGHEYRDVIVRGDYNGKKYKAYVESESPLADLNVDCSLSAEPGNYSIDLLANVERFDPGAMGLTDKLKGKGIHGNFAAKFHGPDFYSPTGQMTITNLQFTDSVGQGISLDPIELTSDFESDLQRINLASDFINMNAEGRINPRSLPGAVKRIMAHVLPQFFPASEAPTATANLNDFTLTATINEDSPLYQWVKIPYKSLYPITLTANMIESEDRADLNLDIPYLQKGNKLIRATKVTAVAGRESSLYAQTIMPSKFGDMTLGIKAEGLDGNIDSDLFWQADNRRQFKGDIAFNARPLNNGTDVRLEESRMVLNDTVWTIDPAYIGVRDKRIVVHGLNIGRLGQTAAINGVVSADSADVLKVELDNIDLDYVFETLNISEAIVFGGKASGLVTAAGLLSKEPILRTNNLYVKDIAYNHCVFGNANIKSNWDNQTRGINIDAIIDGPQGNRSTIDGAIYPLSEELDLRFHANKIPVGFLKPFMVAFATDVSGYASGDAHLFGTFKLVDMTGDLYADNFALTIGFTGVTYFATDSVKMRPGLIDINNLTLRDIQGHTARMDGRLTHQYFKDPAFDFHVTNARNLLVYDIKPTADERWYGKIYGNGSAEIKGHPGIVDISANMSTAENSEFTFVLSDAAQAAEYDFLTFRDRKSTAEVADTVIHLPGSIELDELMWARVRKNTAIAQAASDYNINFQIDVTPAARMILVMDPVAGDRITAHGDGHINFIYTSGNDDMRMYGTYTLNRGDYNFTLQDIILKNFTISEGSTIAFYGDPYDANLDISAIYKLNANLSDLDESFLNDKELQRTNVPVQAVLNVSGKVQQPEIGFDLDFPTLTSDVKRKVKTIVSTDEMMNRQIIYLLALNRFYTPDYMSATKGNELVSVASGTISSQLSNILGQLSDKFSVAPSIRSDAADFSDVEFDVALSSTLLNNRLILNGNLGYRDKSMNNNQFIGDFDLEYLLTRQGNWRVKAYNHFNDRNLYVKQALTTQGLGLVFKHDFDNLLKRKKK